MNYLELVNRMRMECGVSGPRLTSLTGLSQEASRIATWVADAWEDIQGLHSDWEFMRKPVVFNATLQQFEHTPTDAGLTDFANWKRDSFTCSSDGQGFADEQELPFMDYDQFKRLYMFGAARVRFTRPAFMTVTPSKALALGPAPDQNYVISGDYYCTPVRLIEATDEPAIDASQHLMIVYRAMMAYGTFESASEVYGRGELEYRRMLSRLEIDRLPTLTSGPPLA